MKTEPLRKIILTLLSLFMLSPLLGQIDGDATEKTKALYANLKVIQNGHTFLFGQEFFNSFRFNSGSAHGDETYADCFAVTGAYPAVLGSDFHYYLEKSDTERGYHTEAVKWAYQQGFVITFDWHLSGKGTSTYEYTVATQDLLDNIVTDPNGEDRAWYLAELDKVIDIINNDLVVDDEPIPIVFRPLHEMNGGWFWWGSQATSPANYKLMYALTVDYIKERTTSVLFCWSPNTPTNFSYYPGDDYVDVLGLDAYEINATSFRQNIAPIVDHAQANNKVAVFSETGYRNGTGDQAATYWYDTVLPAVVNDPAGKAHKIAWILTWINANWSEPYVPHPASSQAAKQSFIDFKASPYALFSDEIQSMYTPWVITSAPEELVALPEDLTLYPVPAYDQLTITLDGFEKPTRIQVVDMTGKLMYATEIEAEAHTLYVRDVLKTGMYLVRASDASKTISKKLIVR